MIFVLTVSWHGGGATVVLGISGWLGPITGGIGFTPCRILGFSSLALPLAGEDVCPLYLLVPCAELLPSLAGEPFLLIS